MTDGKCNSILTTEFKSTLIGDNVMTFYEIFSDCGFNKEARTAIPEDWEFVCIESTDKYQVYMCEASNVKVFHSEGANYLIALDTGLMIRMHFLI